MGINERFLEFALLGAQWVLWLMVGLSVLGATVAVERILRYRRAARGQAELQRRAALAWEACAVGESQPSDALLDVAAAARDSGGTGGPGPSMVSAVVDGRHLGAAGVGRVVEATRKAQRRGLEKYLGVLGTIGANAPFIGLFGTVLEILRVFNLIGEQGMGSSSQSLTIMTGISEALVATGVGLIVAIPAIIGFNVLTKWLDSIFSQADEIVELTLALVDAEEVDRGRG